MATRREATDLIRMLETKRRISHRDAAVLKDVIRASYQDPVTELGNKRKFEEDLTVKVQEAIRADLDFCVVYADLDKFKPVNDTLGHLIGDKVLRAVGYLSAVATRTYSARGGQEFTAVLSVGRRNNDPAYRFGGDEYGYLIANADLRAGMIAAERYRQAIEGSPFVHGVQMTLGVANFRDMLRNIERDADSHSSLLCDVGLFTHFLKDQADKALYAAKEAGRNRVYGCVSSKPTYSFCTINDVAVNGALQEP